MGGGGGGRRGRMTPDDFERLARLAKDTLRKSGQAAKRNVFLSFAMEDRDEVNLLRGQAKNENAELEFNDWSLREPFDSDNAEYVRRGIRERMRQCSLTLVYLSPSSAKSPWVDWEISESIEMGKAVIGVYRGDRPPTQIPAAARSNRIPLVPWRHPELMRAIKKHSRD